MSYLSIYGEGYSEGEGGILLDFTSFSALGGLE